MKSDTVFGLCNCTECGFALSFFTGLAACCTIAGEGSGSGISHKSMTDGKISTEWITI